MKSCKDCIYIKCLMRTNKEFEVCPVEESKQKSEAGKDNE